MSPAVAVASAAAVAALTLAIALIVQRRGARRRLEAVAARLSVRAGDGGRRGMEGVLHRVERAAEDAVLQAGEARAAAARMGQALEAIPQGVVVCDEAGREVHRNELASAFVGGRHADALVEQAVRELLASAVAGVAERRTLDLFGPPRRVLRVSTAPLHDGARPAGAVAVIEDVSDRRRLEAVRRDFVANVSHELKTPIGALSLLAETLADEDDVEVVRRLARRMGDNADRAARIVEDLLDLSRIEAEENPLREPVQVEQVVAAAVDRVRFAAERRRIDIKVDVDPRHSWRGDRRQLVGAVANLLDNACKYSDDGSPVEVRSRAEGPWVVLEVRDWGAGIPRRDLERVFERFYRVDRARSRDTGGTGLGLAIVRHVATNHRGEVAVESAEGEGSLFILRLPPGPGPVVVSQSEDGTG